MLILLLAMAMRSNLANELLKSATNWAALIM